MKSTDILAATPEKAYTEALKFLEAGRQPEAEQLFSLLARRNPKDQALVFANALLTRSRFDVAAAAPLLRDAVLLDRTSARGQCAMFMLQIDLGSDAAGNFAKLMELTKKSQNDPVILWMGGIAARTLRKNADGVDCYRALLKLWNPGPTLVHQTFGNLLDDLELHEEALEHRKIAVAMEPTAWSLQGLALSLEGLKRYQEADDAYVKTIALAPTSKYYTDWAHMLLDWEHNNDVVEKCAKAVELDPNNARAYGIWGACLARQSFLREAMSLYEKAVKIDPQADWIFDNMALAAKAMGNQAQADEYSKKAAAIRAGNK